ncbi:MAG: archaemetzincin family Zn-dependent metalloprotease [Candidatus Thermoplasmatota archaeon]|nr:archaemetzincin family Zn-dependent metalloprotease [Candidatus Thermoplasmatota archaeon]
MRTAILPIGDMDGFILTHLASELSVFGDVEILPRVDVPESAHRPRRGQYLASDLKELTASYPQDKVLGVVDVDIYEGSNRFVFGLADVKGRSAIISLNRLKGDTETFKQRATKEAFHELGHMFGLRHCQDRSCVMMFSKSLADTDAKQKDYCQFCALRLRTAGVFP